jgi:hypothetical protein
LGVITEIDRCRSIFLDLLNHLSLPIISLGGPVSPILVRPVREQFEHDRVIRLLQARYRRKFEVAINPGPEQNVSVMAGELAVYPDLLLFSQERGRKLLGTVEVETGESVNTLEAMAEWGPFGRLRAPFFLYVPPNSLDAARRLCTEHQVNVSEIWTYHTAADQVRFTMVHRAPESSQPRTKPDRVDITKVATPPAPVRPAPVRVEPPPVPKKPEVAKKPEPAKKPDLGKKPAAAKKAAAATLRQAHGRAEQSRGAKKPAAAKKPVPATVRQAQGRPARSRGAKKAAPAKKPAAKPAKAKTAKPKKAAKRR